MKILYFICDKLFLYLFELKIIKFFIITIGDLMFYNYKILNVNDEEILYLYVNSMFEFSSELGNTKKQEILSNKVNDYIHIMDINFNGKKVMFIVNGLIIASLVLMPKVLAENNDNNQILYKEMIDMNKEDNIDIIDINSNFKDYIENEITNDNGDIISNFVKIKDKSGKTTYIDLNNYITSKLSKIIPATYEDEAIKATAVIARTETFRDLYENNYLDEESFRNTFTLKKLWNKNYKYYFNKLKSAVIDTSYEYLTFNNYFFDDNRRIKHFVPFSSYEANRLAKKGYNYQEILGHFYPDVSLEIVSK